MMFITLNARKNLLFVWHVSFGIIWIFIWFIFFNVSFILHLISFVIAFKKEISFSWKNNKSENNGSLIIFFWVNFFVWGSFLLFLLLEFLFFWRFGLFWFFANIVIIFLFIFIIVLLFILIIIRSIWRLWRNIISVSKIFLEIDRWVLTWLLSWINKLLPSSWISSSYSS